VWGDRVFERKADGSRFAGCDAHVASYVDGYYYLEVKNTTRRDVLIKNRVAIANEYKSRGLMHAIKKARELTDASLVEAKQFVTELQDTYAKNPGFKFPEEEEKKMPTRQYGVNQQMVARFPGKCWLCQDRIVENVDTILPILSERTPRGRHPWVHDRCMKADTAGQPISVHGSETQGPEDNDTPVAVSRFLVDPPRVSQRQIDVLGKNLEAVLKALANNPSQAYALIPTTPENPHIDAVLTTQPILPPKKPEVQAEAASA